MRRHRVFTIMALVGLGMLVVGCAEASSGNLEDTATSAPDSVEPGSDALGPGVDGSTGDPGGEVKVTVCALVEVAGAMTCSEALDADLDLGVLPPGETGQAGLRLTNSGAGEMVYDGAIFLKDGEAVVSAQMSTSMALPGWWQRAAYSSNRRAVRC